MFDKHLNMYVLQKHLAKLKQTKRFSHWNKLGSQAVQNVTERIDRAYKLFFANLKRHVRTAPPSFKARRKYKSFTLKQTAGWKLLPGNELLIGKQKYKYHKSRDVVGIVKTVTIKRDALGDLYVYFSCDNETEIVSRTLTGQSAGFDFGLKTFLVASDGNDIISPLFFKQNIDVVKHANRKLSRISRRPTNVNDQRERTRSRVGRLVRHESGR